MSPSKPTPSFRLIIGLMLVAMTPLSAQTWTGNPSQDATIYEEAELASGSGDLIVGRTNGRSNGTFRRSLLAFDLSEIPAGATITDVSLTLTVGKRGPRASSISYDLLLHRLTASWSEGPFDGGGQGADPTDEDVTYGFRQFDGEPWQNRGGDFLETPSATFPVDGTVGRNSKVVITGAGMVADIQAWINDPSQNHGWMMRGGEASNLNGGTIHFFGRQDNLPADLPAQLAVSYTMDSPTWYGFPVDANSDVNTETWLGWVNVQFDPYLWSYSLQRYIVVPDDSGWVYIERF